MSDNCSHIVIENATTHNLKGLSLKIPRNKVVVFTGVSGSGKSSLVFETIYTEAQRQLIETFSTFARSRMPKLSRPDVDHINNLGTAIIIDQKRMGANPRSTVGTATEINTYLRLLFSRCGEPQLPGSHLFSFNHPQGMCPECHGRGEAIGVDLDALLDTSKSLREGAINHPNYRIDAWHWREMIVTPLFDPDKALKDYTVEEMDTLLYAKGVTHEMKHAGGTYKRKFVGIVNRIKKHVLSKDGGTAASTARQKAFDACFSMRACTTCGGARLTQEALAVRLGGRGIAELMDMELTSLTEYLKGIDGPAARPIVTKMRAVLGHLVDIGVGYLSLSRPVGTLSGGESQRVKMARQLDCDLVGLMYVMDEPSVGLHSRDTDRLVRMLYQLRDKGNTVLVVEHDPDIIRAAEWIVDIGPQAGAGGGQLIYNGPPSGLAGTGSATAMVFEPRAMRVGGTREATGQLAVTHATSNNLKNVSIDIPTGVFTCITGVAGSGKSSLVHNHFLKQHPDAIVIDQGAIGANSRSNPATYTGVFDMIRKQFATANGVAPGMFSFNSSGACVHCKGRGTLSLELHFLDDVTVPCDECQGKRYSEDVLTMKLKGKSIHDVLSMTVDQALAFFRSTPSIHRKLSMVSDVGLGYLQLGQPLSTSSGGEAQRVKLASELHKAGALYVLDEPTTGLHLQDVARLMGILDRIVDTGNTVVVIEHNMDVIAAADWVIDVGPEAGAEGGRVLFEGTPTDLAGTEGHTARFLRAHMEEVPVQGKRKARRVGKVTDQDIDISLSDSE